MNIYLDYPIVLPLVQLILAYTSIVNTVEYPMVTNYVSGFGYDVI